MPPASIGITITTSNAPSWFSKVLTGYECQTLKPFRVLIADADSGEETRALIETFLVARIGGVHDVFVDELKKFITVRTAEGLSNGLSATIQEPPLAEEPDLLAQL